MENDMISLSSDAVEKWLDLNPSFLIDYVQRKADTALINKWLSKRGYTSIKEPQSPRLESSHEGSPSSPHDADKFNFENKHSRSNSKKYLRKDYAKSKFKNMFRTYEPMSARESSIESRRSSLKEMRQFKSLPTTSITMLSILIQSRVRLPRYPSKDVDHKRELRRTNEREFFLEIVKDISNDLSVKSLSEKITENIGILVDADKSSLFLVQKKSNGKFELVSKLFDLHSGAHILPSTSTGDGSVRIPWGKGIIGWVAENGQVVNILDASDDPRYNDEVDKVTGYKVDSLLCMPIKDGDGEILGVAQVLNRGEGEGFTKDDQRLLETYLTFCGIAIHNAQVFEAYTKEYERNRALLEVVHDLFEEQTSLENVILKIMQRAQTLLKCERCTVLLSDATQECSFNKVFDLACPSKNGHTQRQETCSDLKLGNKIAEQVLISGDTINITDAYQDSRFDQEADKLYGFHTRSILCKPIRNRHFHIIGVAQIVNRIDGFPFDEHDDQFFEAFTIFCGLGINNCLLYEEVALSSAKQTVALEVLSYHAATNDDELRKIKILPIPDVSRWNLREFSFNDYLLSKDEMVLASISIFKELGLLRKFRIDYETLCRWLLTVRKNYRNVAYHNWRHAFNVCQVMFTSLLKSKSRKYFSDKEVLAHIVACLCHDLDHRGTNNAFQTKTGSALSQLYGTNTTLEQHHFNHAVMILNSDGHNIFANLSSDDYSEVINHLKTNILATDLSLHLQVREKFFAMVDDGVTTWDDRDCKSVLRKILMTSCDIATITKPWDIQQKAAGLVMEEFFDQGDKERNELKIQPQANMDRERREELPKLQLGWIDGICVPLYKALAKYDDGFQPMLEYVMSNRSKWEILDSERLNKSMCNSNST